MLNAWTHAIIDGSTANIYEHYVRKEGFKRGFFNCLGIDQFLHVISLFATAWLLIKF